MWMNDYEYEFMQDSIEKKGTARSARNARTHCGKSGAVRLPSDYKTKKELKAMSGEVIQYASLKESMTWDQFKALPNDLKVTYIKWIREKFNAPDTHIAKMFGVSSATIGLYFKDLKLSVGRDSGNNRKWEKEKFYAWVNGIDENAVEGTADVEPEGEWIPRPEFPVAEQIDIPEEDPVRTSQSFVAPTCCIPVIPKTGSMSFEHNRVEDILQTVQTLLQGAGVRINCTISWEVVATSDSKEDF